MNEVYPVRKGAALNLAHSENKGIELHPSPPQEMGLSNGAKKPGVSYWLRLIFFLALPIFLALSPFLVGGKVFGSGDAINLEIPKLEFYHQALAEGKSFFWNPHDVSGTPFAASFWGTLVPWHILLFKYLPAFPTYNWLVFINLFLAAFFTALLLKNFGLSIWAQIFGGLIFVFSQWFTIDVLGIVEGLAVFPLLFLLLVKSEEKLWPVWVGGLVLGYSFISVHYNWLLMILVGTFLFALFLGRRAVGKFFIMNVIGILIGLVQLWPAYVYSQFSARQGSFSWAEARVGAIGIFDLPRLFLPYFRLPLISHAESQMYLGLVPLFLGLVGIWLKDRLVRFFSFLFLGSVLVALQYSPLFWLVHKLPFFSSFRGPSRWMFVGFFAFSVLAAFALDRFEEISEKVRKVWMMILGLVGVIGVVAAVGISFVLMAIKEQLLAFLLIFFERNIYPRTSRLPLEYYREVMEGFFQRIQEVFDFGNPKFLFSLLFLFLSVLAIFLLTSGAQRVTKKTLITLAVANLVVIFVFFHPLFPRALLHTNSQVVGFLQTHEGKAFPFLSGFSQWSKLTVPYGEDIKDSYFFQIEQLTPNLNLLYQIPSADGYENLMPRRQARLLALLGSDRATTGEKLADEKISPEEKVKKFTSRKNLLDILGIRYLISAFPLDEKIFPKVFEAKATKSQIPISVYENPAARPLAYFAKEVETLKVDEEVAYQKLIKQSAGSPELLECEICPAISPLSGEEAEVEILDKANEKLVLKTRSQKEAVLVFTQNHLPGWEALIDGRPAELYTVNSVFMGVVVPAGEHEVEFVYNYFDLFQFRKIFGKIKPIGKESKSSGAHLIQIQIKP